MVHAWMLGSRVRRGSLAMLLAMLAMLLVVVPDGAMATVMTSSSLLSRSMRETHHHHHHHPRQPRHHDHHDRRDADSMIAEDATARQVSGSATDCFLRELTQEVVASLEPADFVGSSWGLAAADALRLSTLCNFSSSSSSSSSSLSSTHTSRRHLPRNPRVALESKAVALSCDASYYVDGKAGSDGNNGTLDSPFASLYHALYVSRDRQGGAIASPCIFLRGGTYYLGEMPPATAGQPNDSQFGYIDLTSADSGLTISSYNGETVVLSGGARFRPSWKPSSTLADGTIYTTTLPPTLLTDSFHFNELFVNGTRAVRAKWPNGDPSTHGLYSVDTGFDDGDNITWIPPNAPAQSVEIHVSVPTLPNRYFTQNQMGYGGPAAVYSPPRSFWALSDPPGGGGATYVLPLGMAYVNDSDFAARVAKWVNPGVGFVHAFHRFAWANWVFPIALVDPLQSTLTFGRGGFQDARGNAEGSAFYVDNLLEELDAPREWFFDEPSSTLYYMTNGTSTQPPTLGEILVSQLPCLISVHGSPDDPVSNVLLSGLTFAHTSNTLMRAFEVPSGGDWALHRGGALFVSGARNLRVQDSVFTQLGGSAVVVSNWNLDVQVTRNEFVWNGDSGVLIVGSAPDVDGVVNTNQPTNTVVSSNLFHELGIYIKQSAPVFLGIARSTVVTGNAMFNVPRAGINVNDGFYGNKTLDHNAIFNAVRETTDHGPINTWDRSPHLTMQRNATTGMLEATLYPATSHITRNWLFNTYSSLWPIDHDDGSQHYNDSYNVQVYGGYKNNLGNSKTARYSLYVYPDGQRFESVHPVLTRAAQRSLAAKRDAVASWMQRGQQHSSAQHSSAQHSSAQHSSAAATVQHAPHVSLGWGQSCAQLFASQPNLIGWDEAWFNNTCIMQSSNEPYQFDNCQFGSQTVPYLANNQLYTPPGNVSIACAYANGTSATMTLSDFQRAGYELGSFVSTPPSVQVIGQWATSLFLEE